MPRSWMTGVDETASCQNNVLQVVYVSDENGWGYNYSLDASKNLRIQPLQVLGQEVKIDPNGKTVIAKRLR
jgi:hypothetical protein